MKQVINYIKNIRPPVKQVILLTIINILIILLFLFLNDDF